MNRIKKFLKRQDDFTLIETLIVVAIIAILVAVSIPLATSNLNKAKQAADDANLRAAKTAAALDYMEDSTLTGKYYDLEKGAVTNSKRCSYASKREDFVGAAKLISQSFSIKNTVLLSNLW